MSQVAAETAEDVPTAAPGALTKWYVVGVLTLVYVFNFVDRQIVSFRLPGSVRRVAEPAPQIAARGPDKDAFGPGQLTFALSRVVEFRDPHVS